MGMIGNYLAVHAEMLQSIRTEEVSLHEIGPKLDIDKSWQALHYILNGGQEGNHSPLGAAVPLTSHYIGHFSDAEVFALEPDEVKLTAEALEGIEEAWLREHYPFRQMMEEGIYPLMDDDEADEFFDYIYTYFQAIREFYQQASASASCVVFYIS
ncbi:YfbM family protein [Paenibacillus silagei]|uniref:DUF1877 family protein n=1 Tax=Paenibacillus silagei TaxID=1670801 RepID=A0ABS4NPX6_9BACL|nr:YfbM family protein [Paenibacillus silagei]MBP2112100.1 hypothetical protein [Paenibacillus silagei]